MPAARGLGEPALEEALGAGLSGMGDLAACGIGLGELGAPRSTITGAKGAGDGVALRLVARWVLLRTFFLLLRTDVIESSPGVS